MKYISRLILKLFRFKITGTIPNHIPKKIMVVVPHTSNWDFLLGIIVRSAYEIDVNYVAKHTLFNPPFGWFFRWLGGIPINRTKSANTVRTMAELFRSRERMAIVITPEGTRKKVSSLKKGFYYIAKGANIPIIPIKFDFENKEVHFGDAFYPSGDEEADLAFFDTYYDGILGKVPEYSYGFGRPS